MIANKFDAWIQKPIEDAVFLTGPTASGKSAVALELAEQLNAEIISVDSMAVYRGMDIGTAKPSQQEREKVPHHLIDVVNPTCDYSVSQFVMDAHQKAEEIRSRGRKVLLVGGTPLYMKSLLCGMFLGPPADWEFRDAVQKDVDTYGVEALKQRLMQVDTISAHKILAGDVRRMIRALEVTRLTGIPMSHWQIQFERMTIPKSCKAFVLSWDRASLHQRVNTRVDQMFERGLIDEVKSLISTFGHLGRTASQAVGYKEPLEYLGGQLERDDMIAQVKAHTRQFVRRQEIWFRSMPEIVRIPIDREDSLREAPNQILAQVTSA